MGFPMSNQLKKGKGAPGTPNPLSEFALHILFTACQFLVVAAIAIFMDQLIEQVVRWHWLEHFTLAELSEAHAKGTAWMLVLGAFPFVVFKLADGAILLADISLLGIYVLRHLRQAARGEQP